MSFVQGFLEAVNVQDPLYKNIKRNLLIQSVLTEEVENEIHKVFRENKYDDNWQSKYTESFPLTIILPNLLATLIIMMYSEYRYKLHIESKRNMSANYIKILWMLCSFYENHEMYCNEFKKVKFQNEREILWFFHWLLTSNYNQNGNKKKNDGTISILYKILKSMNRFEVVLRRNNKNAKSYYSQGNLNTDMIYEIVSTAIHKEKLQEKHYKNNHGSTDDYIFRKNLHSKLLRHFKPFSSKTSSPGFGMSLSPSQKSQKSTSEFATITNNNNKFIVNPADYEFHFSDDDITNNNNNNNDNEEYEKLQELFHAANESKQEENDKDEMDEIDSISEEHSQLLDKLQSYGYSILELMDIYQRCKKKGLFDEKTARETANIILNYLLETE
eukprot:406788_1